MSKLYAYIGHRKTVTNFAVAGIIRGGCPSSHPSREPGSRGAFPDTSSAQSPHNDVSGNSRNARAKPGNA